MFWGVYFPSFSEGLSLRRPHSGGMSDVSVWDFPSFSEGLSLRHFGGGLSKEEEEISLPFRRDFH